MSLCDWLLAAWIYQELFDDEADHFPLITYRFQLSEVEETYRICENKSDRMIKVAII